MRLENHFLKLENSRNIHVFLDNPHMLKLARNCFASKNLYLDNKLIDWNLIVKLHEKQKHENFNLGNKLTRRHIEWYNKKMNLRLAAETMSCSVANSLQQLSRDGVEGFEDSEATIQKLDTEAKISRFQFVQQPRTKYSNILYMLDHF